MPGLVGYEEGLFVEPTTAANDEGTFTHNRMAHDNVSPQQVADSPPLVLVHCSAAPQPHIMQRG